MASVPGSAPSNRLRAVSANGLNYSVVIAAYRRPQLLCQTLQHLMPQVGRDGEVIVVEQAPLQDLRTTLARYDRLRHIILPRPSTVAARNHAIKLVRGSVLIFIDDDVITPPGFISAHLQGYADSTIGGVAGRVIEASRRPIEDIDPRSLDPIDGWRWSTFDHTREMDVPHAPTCNLSLLREAVIQVGGFDPGFQLAWREDSDLCFRIHELGYRIRFRPAAALTHLSASEGGTRVTKAGDSRLGRELRMYRKHFLHYRDNLYFICKHFHGAKRARWIVDAYRSYVGLSRWPWRLLAKHAIFFVALCQADRWARYRRYHSCSLSD